MAGSIGVVFETSHYWRYIPTDRTLGVARVYIKLQKSVHPHVLRLWCSCRWLVVESGCHGVTQGRHAATPPGGAKSWVPKRAIRKLCPATPIYPIGGGAVRVRTAWCISVCVKTAFFSKRQRYLLYTKWTIVVAVVVCCCCWARLTCVVPF